RRALPRRRRRQPARLGGRRRLPRAVPRAGALPARVRPPQPPLPVGRRRYRGREGDRARVGRPHGAPHRDDGGAGDGVRPALRHEPALRAGALRRVGRHPRHAPAARQPRLPDGRLALRPRPRPRPHRPAGRGAARARRAPAHRCRHHARSAVRRAQLVPRHPRRCRVLPGRRRCRRTGRLRHGRGFAGGGGAPRGRPRLRRTPAVGAAVALGPRRRAPGGRPPRGRRGRLPRRPRVVPRERVVALRAPAGPPRPGPRRRGRRAPAPLRCRLAARRRDADGLALLSCREQHGRGGAADAAPPRLFIEAGLGDSGRSCVMGSSGLPAVSSSLYPSVRAMNTAHSDVRFGTAALATGVRLHYAEAGPPDGAPVLFLPGLSDSWFSSSPVLPHLPPSLRALALSQRGHGDSERPPAGYTKADLAADVVAFLDAMGIARATVVGHSMGSAVAQRVAASYPERVARLVLAGSYVTARTEDLLALNEEIRALTDPVPDALARAFQHSTIHRPLPEVFVDAVVAESLKLP